MIALQDRLRERQRSPMMLRLTLNDRPPSGGATTAGIDVSAHADGSTRPPIRKRHGVSTDLVMPTRGPTIGSNGGSVPLKVVADIRFGSGPVQIQRTNQIRRISLGADLAPGLVSGDAMPLIDKLRRLQSCRRASRASISAKRNGRPNFS